MVKMDFIYPMLVLLSVIILFCLIVGENVRESAQNEPPPSYGDPEIDAIIQFARLVGVQTGYSWGAFFRSSVERQEAQMVEAIKRLQNVKPKCT